MTRVVLLVAALLFAAIASTDAAYCNELPSGPMPQLNISRACQDADLPTWLSVAGCVQTECQCYGGTFDLVSLSCKNRPNATCPKMSCTSESFKCMKAVFDRWTPSAACTDEAKRFAPAKESSFCGVRVCLEVSGCTDAEYIDKCGSLSKTPAPGAATVCTSATMTTTVPSFSSLCLASTEFTLAAAQTTKCAETECACLGGTLSGLTCSATISCSRATCRASRRACESNIIDGLRSVSACSGDVDAIVAARSLTCFAESCAALPGCTDDDYNLVCASSASMVRAAVGVVLVALLALIL